MYWNNSRYYGLPLLRNCGHFMHVVPNKHFYCFTLVTTDTLRYCTSTVRQRKYILKLPAGQNHSEFLHNLQKKKIVCSPETNSSCFGIYNFLSRLYAYSCEHCCHSTIARVTRGDEMEKQGETCCPVKSLAVCMHI